MKTTGLLAAIWPHRWWLAISLALMLIEAATVLAVPWLGGRIALGLFGDSTVSLNTLAPILVCLLALQALLRLAHRRMIALTVAHLGATVRTGLYDHLQRLPVGFFQGRRRGDLLALLTREVDDFSRFVTDTLIGIIPRLLIVVGALILLARLDPVLALPVLIGIPSFYVLMKLIGRGTRRLAGQIREAYADVIAIAEQNLSIIPAIKAFTREDIERERLEAAAARLRDLNARMAKIQSALGPVSQFVSAAGVVVLLWLASDRLAGAEMSAGDFVSLLLYAAILTRPVSALADSWGQFQHARGALRHMRDVLSTAAEPIGGSINLGSIRGEIQFENVSFSYPDRPLALQDVSITIPAGETVAITGENGAGKSTLIELLLRFQETGHGRISLDGVDISKLDLSTLRRAIAVVPQRVMLIDGTIEENIRFGCFDATSDDIRSAALGAQAWSFIRALPNGLATRIGDHGVKLSGGQRQRLALARALLKDPAVLVLDEPTAMFDPDAERRFVDVARSKLSGRTVILITHRPASLALADRIVTLRAGSIVGEQIVRMARGA